MRYVPWMTDRNELRRLLNGVLRVDADLDAFCLDFFPDVQQRFSAGMDRHQKVNLLFQLASDPEQIIARLRTFAEPLDARPPRLQVASRKLARWSLRHGVLSGSALLLLCLLSASSKPLKRLMVSAPGPALVTSSAARPPDVKTLQVDRCRSCVRHIENLPSTPDIMFGKLPHVASLIGREAELKQLDNAWDGAARRRVVSIVAVGGQGKTTLVVNWLLRLGRARYRGARHVFFWSFYNQGTSDRWSISSDEFMATALRFFGDPDPDTGHPLDKAYRLAKILRKERTLLVLDGLEPLQNPPRDPEQEGLLTDQALAVLLQNLAAANSGMVVITSRIRVADLDPFEAQGATQTIGLRPFSDDNGVALLRHVGVRGFDDELMAAVRDFKGHPLALTLLGSLLRDAYAGDIRRRTEVGLMARPDGRDSQAQRAMAAYDKWFGPGPERAVLRLLGLFDRSAPVDALNALRREPVIAGLNETLAKLKQAEWNQVMARLRRAGLVDEALTTDTETIDAHPLVRAHFGDALRRENEAAWIEGHRRLYAWYAASAKDLPDTSEEMEPLYAAVLHGCRAGDYKRTLDEVYQRRIERGSAHYSIDKLGAFGAVLASMSNFFEEPWLRPLAALDKQSQSLVLEHASYALRGLGRMREAATPMRLILRLDKTDRNPGWATTSASNLSEVELALGHIEEAIASARQGVQFADQLDERQIVEEQAKMTKERTQELIEFMKERWVISRTTLADALHQRGRTADALHFFIEAEALQRKREPAFPILHGLEGYQYYDLLLAMGRTDEVLSRSKQLLVRKDPRDPLLDTAMNVFALGRAHLTRFTEGDTKEAPAARRYLDEGIARLRESGYQDYLAYGLIHRAAFFRHDHDFPSAAFDLDEALRIAASGQMKLAEADVHLERARLDLGQRHFRVAREALFRAQAIIAKTRYHRRDNEVVEIKKRLGKSICAQSRPRCI